jgi:AAA domain
LSSTARGNRARAQPLTTEQLMTKHFEPAKYAIPGIIVEGLTLFAGKPKIGKSWLLMHAAVAVGCGGFTLGDIKCPEGDVLYCALEDSENRLQTRLRKLFGHDRSSTGARVWWLTQLPRLDDGCLDVIEQWADSVALPRLIIIDTLAMVRAPRKRDETNYDADYAAVRELRTLANQRGIAIVLVHHLRKQKADDPFDTISGTLGLTAGPDSVLLLKRDARGFTLHGLGRDIAGIEESITFDPASCTWAILGDVAATQQSNERAAILTALEEADEPLGPKHLSDLIDGKQANVRRLLGKMVRDGEVERVKYGRYRVPTSVT